MKTHKTAVSGHHPIRLIAIILLFVVIVGMSTSVRAANPGDLDTTFSTDGLTYTDIGSGTVDSARAVAVQPTDHYIVAAGLSDANMALVRYTDAGVLDTSFGGGKITINPSANADVLQAVAIDGNGKIVAAGFSDDGAGLPVAVVVVRYNSNGTPDTGFGTNGVVSLGFAALGGSTTAEATAVAIDSSNNIIVAGQVDDDFLLLRLNSTNGSLDTTGFNAASGYYTLDVSGGARADMAYGVVIQSSGRIVAGGMADLGDHQNFAMIRVTANGTLDTTFGTSGIVSTDISGGTNVNDLAYALALDPSTSHTDYLVLAGVVETGTGEVGLARYTANGVLDTTFSGDGKVLTAVTAATDWAYSAQVQATGKILVSGFTTDPTSNENFMVLRYNLDGSLDTSFGTNGVVLTDIGTVVGSGNANSQDEAFASALTPLNQLVVVGNTDVPLNNGDANFAVARYDLENTPPVVTDISKSGLEDADISFTATDFSDQFTDANGETLQSVQITSLPTHGDLFLSTTAVSLNQEIAVSQLANLSYTPDLNYNGADSFGWNGSDGQDYAASAASVNISITAVNDPPSFTAGSNQTILEDAGAQTVANWAQNLSAGGGTDENTQTLTFTVSNNNEGLFSSQPAISSAGTLTYTPADNAFGSATISVFLADNGGTANGGDNTSATVQFTITITGVNDAPSFTSGGNISVNEDSGAYSATWATNISAGPGESDSVFFVLSNVTNNGLFSQPVSINPAGTMNFTPAADANGSSSMTVTLQDTGGTANGGVNLSTQVQITITVNAVNDAPSFTIVASPDQTVLEDAGGQTVTGFVTGTEVGPVNESSQSILAYVVSADTPALFATQPAINPTTGTLTYTPADNANGSATITVQAQDDGGTANGGVDTSAAQQFTISITAVNDPPSLSLGTNPIVDEDTGAQTLLAFATSIVAGPADEAGQTISLASPNFTNAALFATGGQPNLNLATGTFSFTPAADANGTSTYTFSVQDNGGTANGGDDTSTQYSILITVTAVNDPPTFNTLAGNPPTVLEDAGAQSVVNFASGMSAGPANELGQTLTFNLTTTNDSLFATGPAINATTGELTYTPAANANGSATVTVTLSDDGGDSDTSAAQQFTIAVTAVNDAPSFTNSGDVNVDEEFASLGSTITGWASAISAGPADEAGQQLTFAITSNSNPSLFTALPAVDPDTGDLTFTAVGGSPDSAILGIQLQDDGGTANGGTNSTAVVNITINVTFINDAPTFDLPTAPNQTVAEDSGAHSVGNFATNIYSGSPTEFGQVMTFTLVTDNNTLFAVPPAIHATTGDLTYTLAANANGSATVTVTLQDSGGTANGGVDTSSPQIFTITVTAVPDPPILTTVNISGDENSTISFSRTVFENAFTDADGDSLVRVRITSLPTNGTLHLNNSPITINQEITAGQLNQLTFTPDTDWFGATSFTWNGSDGTLYATSAATANITVNQVKFFTYLPLIIKP